MQSKDLLSISTRDALKRWDLVVILSGNKAMTRQCELYLNWLHEYHSYPLERILILPDPPGPKIESFGAIGACINYLHETYGDTFLEWKVLAIMNGGYNMRMPFCVNKSKLFTVLPVSGDGSMCHLFDVKVKFLSVYIPLMPRGSILVTCSDDIETYTFDVGDLGERVSADLTATGHPSSIQIGTGHGVYVVEKDKVVESKSIVSLPCLEVLQKPSQDLMKEKGAIISEHGDGIVITDSVFWMSSDLISKISSIYTSLSPLKCEVDIYRDVLPFFGSNQNKHRQCAPELMPTETKCILDEYKRVFQTAFENEPLEVLVERKSNFYHFGTMREYLNLICRDEGCRDGLNLSRVCLCTGHFADPSGNTETDGVVICSAIDAPITSHALSIVEFCRISTPTVISNNVILSHCSIGGSDTVSIPANVTMFTVSMEIDGEEKYCTLAFGCDDDMKLKIFRHDSQATFLNTDLASVLRTLELTPEEVFESEVSSMWDLKVFPIADTMESSFASTLGLVKTALQLSGDKYSCTNQTRMSLRMCLSLRSYQHMFNFQKSLMTGFQNNNQ